MIAHWILENSLWLVGIGLMLASSGIDGAYMARWMTDLPGVGGAAVLGYVLNTTSDIGGMVLTYWYGRFSMNRSSTKRRMARFLLGAEVVAVLYSWMFGWRQLRIVLAGIESDANWVAPVAAGFIPLLLAFVGYAQALLSGRIESEPSDAQRRTSAIENAFQDARQCPSNAPEQWISHPSGTGPLPKAITATDSDAPAYICPHCGRSDFQSPQALSAHLRFCSAYRAQKEASDAS